MNSTSPAIFTIGINEKQVLKIIFQVALHVRIVIVVAVKAQLEYNNNNKLIKRL